MNSTLVYPLSSWVCMLWRNLGQPNSFDAEVAVSDINYHFLAPHLKLRIFLLEIRRRNERWSRYGHCRSQGQNCGRKIEQDRSLAMKMLFDAVKRENVVLQFEVCLQRSARREFFLRYFHFSYICFSFTEMRTSKAPQK
jgi:hypothetical protein